ncbi:hypothetical protein [Planctomyces sp. SH-PL62]|uniref:hypothetical protein n=1 Tax=Planctomyces sp. SH-PL62 TaxID=1636152 RepID=UPI00078BEAAF|nr:hypothetical protein [Planctomyces sp. SH-PL62]AMV39748.1 periplasmic folding chaperone [Planctomyces sp. SH-PL62]
MPFEVFRRHQRKMLAVLAILAMFSFVLADSLPRLFGVDYSGPDVEVAKLFGRTVRRSDLNEMARQRNRANLFMAALNPYSRDGFFGGLKERDLIDALILEKEAVRLGMPADPITGRDWLKARTGGQLNREMFEMLYSRFSSEISQEDLLADLANQVRIAKVRSLLGRPPITPYDVYQSYRGQTERVADKLVEIPVENFVGQVGEPSQADLQELYEKYKDVLPDPASETPGFKVPRQVQVEFVSLDGGARARELRDKMTDSELQAYYENHKSEFKVPSELPDDLFADAPDLTPAVIQPLGEIRSLLASRLADEKAQEGINEVFGQIRDEVLIPYADQYLTMLDEKAAAPNAPVEAPKEVDLKALAQEKGLAYEITPLLTREQAGRYGLIANAQVGSTRLSGGRRFADEFLDSKVGLYEPVELTDIQGTRYLARKVKDEAPRIPTLEEVKADVARAWKLAKARPLAEKAAQDLAAKIKTEKNAKLDEDQIEGYNVVSIPAITRMQIGGLGAGPFDYVPQTETPIPDVDYAGDDFRDAYFGVKEGETAVASNLPKTTYYVVVPDRREPVAFAQLYAPNGEEMRFNMLAGDEAAIRQDETWMNRLRRQAGLPADWAPPDEKAKDDDFRS